VHNAEDVEARAIVALTESGSTPKMIARYKPQQPIFVVSPNEITLRQIALVFGCYPLEQKGFGGVHEMIKEIPTLLIKKEYAKKDDKCVVCAGVPFGVQGGTNLLVVLTV
jgi:pyruvate kinase